MFFITSCQDEPPRQEKKTTTEDLIAEDDVLHFIVQYYQKEFHQYKEEKNISDSIIELSYLGKLPEDTFESWLSAIYIPANMQSAHVFSGDLNKDSLPELVIEVKTEGGGVGSNSADFEYFLFLNKGKGYQFLKAYTSSSIAGCEGNYGFFMAESISDNQLRGTSMCYTEEDSRCCPSLYFESSLSLLNNRLVMTNKVAKQGPKESL